MSVSVFNFSNFLTKNAINFDQKEIERKKYLVGMKFCCASNAAIKMSKSQKNQPFSQNIFNKIAIFKKVLIFKKICQLGPRYEGQLTRMAEPIPPSGQSTSYTLTTSSSSKFYGPTSSDGT